MGIDEIKNRIINSDCMDILKELPDNCIDLVVTDPPYKKVQGGRTSNKSFVLSGASEDELAKGKYFDKNMIKFEDWIPECYRVLKDGTHCYIMSDDRNLYDVLDVSFKSGFKLLNILTWKKSRSCPNRYYMNNSEFICLLRKGTARSINNMGTKRVLEFDNVKNKIHPTEKPKELMNCLIENSSDKGNLILEPFSGSGVVAECCKELGRDFICIEKDYNYWKSSIDRLNNLSSSTITSKKVSVRRPLV